MNKKVMLFTSSLVSIIMCCDMFIVGCSGAGARVCVTTPVRIDHQHRHGLQRAQEELRATDGAHVARAAGRSATAYNPLRSHQNDDGPRQEEEDSDINKNNMEQPQEVNEEAFSKEVQDMLVSLENLLQNEVISGIDKKGEAELRKAFNAENPFFGKDLKPIWFIEKPQKVSLIYEARILVGKRTQSEDPAEMEDTRKEVLRLFHNAFKQNCKRGVNCDEYTRKLEYLIGLFALYRKLGPEDQIIEFANMLSVFEYFESKHNKGSIEDIKNIRNSFDTLNSKYAELINKIALKHIMDKRQSYIDNAIQLVKKYGSLEKEYNDLVDNAILDKQQKIIKQKISGLLEDNKKRIKKLTESLEDFNNLFVSNKQITEALKYKIDDIAIEFNGKKKDIGVGWEIKPISEEQKEIDSKIEKLKQAIQSKREKMEQQLKEQVQKAQKAANDKINGLIDTIQSHNNLKAGNLTSTEKTLSRFYQQLNKGYTALGEEHAELVKQHDEIYTLYKAIIGDEQQQDHQSEQQQDRHRVNDIFVDIKKDLDDAGKKIIACNQVIENKQDSLNQFAQNSKIKIEQQMRHLRKDIENQVANILNSQDIKNAKSKLDDLVSNDSIQKRFDAMVQNEVDAIDAKRKNEQQSINTMFQKISAQLNGIKTKIEVEKDLNKVRAGINAELENNLSALQGIRNVFDIVCYKFKGEDNSANPEAVVTNLGQEMGEAEISEKDKEWLVKKCAEVLEMIQTKQKAAQQIVEAIQGRQDVLRKQFFAEKPADSIVNNTQSADNIVNNAPSHDSHKEQIEQDRKSILGAIKNLKNDIQNAKDNYIEKQRQQESIQRLQDQLAGLMQQLDVNNVDNICSKLLQNLKSVQDEHNELIANITQAQEVCKQDDNAVSKLEPMQQKEQREKGEIAKFIAQYNVQRKGLLERAQNIMPRIEALRNQQQVQNLDDEAPKTLEEEIKSINHNIESLNKRCSLQAKEIEQNIKAQYSNLLEIINNYVVGKKPGLETKNNELNQLNNDIKNIKYVPKTDNNIPCFDEAIRNIKAQINSLNGAQTQINPELQTQINPELQTQINQELQIDGKASQVHQALQNARIAAGIAQAQDELDRKLRATLEMVKRLANIHEKLDGLTSKLRELQAKPQELQAKQLIIQNLRNLHQEKQAQVAKLRRKKELLERINELRQRKKALLKRANELKQQEEAATAIMRLNALIAAQTNALKNKWQKLQGELSKRRASLMAKLDHGICIENKKSGLPRFVLNSAGIHEIPKILPICDCIEIDYHSVLVGMDALPKLRKIMNNYSAVCNAANKKVLTSKLPISLQNNIVKVVNKDTATRKQSIRVAVEITEG